MRPLATGLRCFSAAWVGEIGLVAANASDEDTARANKAALCNNFQQKTKVKFNQKEKKIEPRTMVSRRKNSKNRDPNFGFCLFLSHTRTSCTGAVRPYTILQLPMDRRRAAAALVGAALAAALFLKRRRCSDAKTPSIVVLGDIFVDILVQSDQLPVWGEDVVAEDPIIALPGGSALNTATHLASSFAVPTDLWSAIGT